METMKSLSLTDILQVMLALSWISASAALASGSGSGSGLPPAECLCDRSVECSISGRLTRDTNVVVNGTELKCTIMLNDEMLDTGSGSSFIRIDESFFQSTQYLSAGSLLFLTSLGVLSRDEVDGFYGCTVPSGLPLQGAEGSIQTLALTFIHSDESFGNAIIPIPQSDINATLNDQLDEVNQCSLINLQQWLSTQSQPLNEAECRDNTFGEGTNVFFEVECPLP